MYESRLSKKRSESNKFFELETRFFKVNSGNTRTMGEIYSKLTIKTEEQRHENDIIDGVLDF